MKRNQPHQVHHKSLPCDGKQPDRTVASLAQRYEELLGLRKRVEDLTRKSERDDRASVGHG
jgi:hypothetical protein